MKKCTLLIMFVLLLSTICMPTIASDNVVTVKSDGYNDISFSNGYNGFCLDKWLDMAYEGDSFVVKDTSEAINNVNGENISQYLKILFVDFFVDNFEKDGNGEYKIKNAINTQAIIYGFADRDSKDWDYSPLTDIVSKYNEGRRISDHGETIVVGDDVITFDFIVMESQKSGQQDFFGYKLTVTPADVNENPGDDVNQNPDTDEDVNTDTDNDSDTDEGSDDNNDDVDTDKDTNTDVDDDENTDVDSDENDDTDTDVDVDDDIDEDLGVDKEPDIDVDTDNKDTDPDVDKDEDTNTDTDNNVSTDNDNDGDVDIDTDVDTNPDVGDDTDVDTDTDIDEDNNVDDDKVEKEESNSEPVDDITDGENKAPKTGDNNHINLILVTLFSAVCIAVIIKKNYI